MKIKKAMLVFPPNVLICYDLFILDVLNQHKGRIKKEHYDTMINMLMNVFNGNVVDTPLHKLMIKDDKLVVCDLMTELPSDYSSLNKFIYGKSRFITIDVYDYLIRHGYKDLLPITRVKHQNISCVNILENYNNFIVCDNRNWDELSIMRAIYGGEYKQYIDRDRLIDWMIENIDEKDNGFLELSFVSDAYDIDKEMAIEVYHKYGLKAKFIKTELRMCCLNSENMKRYTESDKKRSLTRSSVGLFKLWDRNNFC